MTNLLIRKFIKDRENTSDPKVRTAYGKLAGVTCIFANVILFIIKLIAGTLLGGISVSIIADAVNNLSDASSGLISLMGFRLSERPADREHPYGHGRYEYISGLFVAVFILVIGVELAKSGIERIFSPEKNELSYITIGILTVSIIIKLWLAVFNRKIGKLISSGTLIATAADSRNDVISTLSVLVCTVLSAVLSFDLDGYAALALSLFILYSGFGLVKEAIAPLLGKAPDSEFVKQIQEKILSYPHVLGIHDMMIHDYGPGRLFGSVHVEMSSELDIFLGHNIIDEIEREIYRDFNLTISIHYDPVATNDERIPELKGFISEKIHAVEPNLSIHDLRIVAGPLHTNVIFDCVIPCEKKINRSELKKSLSDAVSESYPNYYCVINFETDYTGTI
ncbi:MAG: cation diffusion facilitator family transporter [Ruminococcaceae bacterium]|nr:cation diffusion facilitator family transporter [Oscillospiraceae bacterium]